MIVAIVLAAGASRRMGRPKMPLPILNVPILEKGLRVFRKAGVDRVIVVLGSHAAEVRRAVEFRGETVVVNRNYKEGMSGSIRAGLRSAGDAEAVLIALGDQPFLTARTVRDLVMVYRETKAPIVAPVYRGVRGNPVLFDKSLFPRIMRLRGDVGARSVVEENESFAVKVSVRDRGVLADIDTPKDYEAARAAAVRRRRTRGGD